MNNVLCAGTEDAFKDCLFSIDDHGDPSRDVAIQCFPGMILTVTVTVRTGISIGRLQSSFAEIANSRS